jgi:hypothetical protein
MSGKGKGKKKSGGQSSTAASSSAPIPTDISKDSVDLMKILVKQALVSGDYLDIKFYAYSRRKSSGTVYAPKAVYANSYVLRAKVPEYFEPCKLKTVKIILISDISSCAYSASWWLRWVLCQRILERFFPGGAS